MRNEKVSPENQRQDQQLSEKLLGDWYNYEASEVTMDTQEFARLRIGIGKPPTKEQGANYVLKRPTGKLRESLERDVAHAADAIEDLLDFEFDAAQQRVNGS